MTSASVVVLGAPGAGKGTQARPLAAEHGLVYFATGDLLRKAVASGAPAGRTAQRYMDAGTLVPDALVFGLLVEAIARQPAASGLILDGFPRTTTQAETLDAELGALGRPRPLAILIDVPDDVLIGRLSGRRICAEQGHEYHLERDRDGSALVQRDDDEPGTIRRRLAVYHELTEPLVAHYEHQRRLRRVDGQGDPAEIRGRLAAVISGPRDSPLT